MEPIEEVKAQVSKNADTVSRLQATIDEESKQAAAEIGEILCIIKDIKQDMKAKNSHTSTRSTIHGLKVVEEVVSDSQCGCMAGRGYVAGSVSQLLEKAIKHNTKVFLLFMDLHKAYDSVPRQADLLPQPCTHHLCVS